jgi:hypothetical protein
MRPIRHEKKCSFPAEWPWIGLKMNYNAYNLTPEDQHGR